MHTHHIPPTRTSGRRAHRAAVVGLVAAAMVPLFFTGRVAVGQQPVRLRPDWTLYVGVKQMTTRNEIHVEPATAQVTLRMFEGPGALRNLRNNAWVWDCPGSEDIDSETLVVIGTLDGQVTTSFRVRKDPLPRAIRVSPTDTEVSRSVWYSPGAPLAIIAQERADSIEKARKDSLDQAFRYEDMEFGYRRSEDIDRRSFRFRKEPVVQPATATVAPIRYLPPPETAPEPCSHLIIGRENVLRIPTTRVIPGLRMRLSINREVLAETTGTELRYTPPVGIRTDIPATLTVLCEAADQDVWRVDAYEMVFRMPGVEATVTKDCYLGEPFQITLAYPGALAKESVEPIQWINIKPKARANGTYTWVVHDTDLVGATVKEPTLYVWKAWSPAAQQYTFVNVLVHTKRHGPHAKATRPKAH